MAKNCGNPYTEHDDREGTLFEYEIGNYLKEELPNSYLYRHSVVVTVPDRPGAQRVPREIDIAVVGPNGIFLIDAKAYGTRVESTALFEPWISYRYDTLNRETSYTTEDQPAEVMRKRLAQVKNMVVKNPDIKAFAFAKAIFVFKPKTKISIPLDPELASNKKNQDSLEQFRLVNFGQDLKDEILKTPLPPGARALTFDQIQAIMKLLAPGYIAPHNRVGVYAIRRSSQRIYAPNGLSYRLHELAHTEVDPPLKYRGKCYDLSASSNETWSEFENQVKRHGDVLVKLLNTEHVAKWVTHFFDPATDGFWVIEEWFDGESLESIFRGRQEKELNISDVMKQVALGLRELHNPPSALDRIRKITLPKMYHRNLNPSAIWIVRSTKHVILTDFELAKMEGSTYSAVLDKFTPNPYIAPEVIAKAHQANEKSDLYSWGAILFRLVTGGEYAAAKRAEAEQILLSSKLPSTIVDITLKCLEELPSDRPENIDVVIKAISGWK